MWFLYTNRPENTNLVENIEILLPVKFHCISFSGFRKKVENISAYQRPGRPSCFSNRPAKHKFSRGNWDLVYCQVSLNSVLRFHSSKKYLSQSEARVVILFFRSARKHPLAKGHWDVAYRQVSLNCVPQFQRTSKHVSTNRKQGRPSCFSDRPRKHKLDRGHWDLASVKFRWIPRSGSREKFENVSVNQRPGRPSCFPIGHKNTNLAEDNGILLPDKFRWIPFCGLRGEVENISANQRPGRPSCFSNRLEKHKLGKRRWVIASCLVSLNSIRKSKMWKVNDGRTDGRTTDSGQRVITIVHLSFWLRCTKQIRV